MENDVNIKASYSKKYIVPCNQVTFVQQKRKINALLHFSLKAELPLASVRALTKAAAQGLIHFHHLSLHITARPAGISSRLLILAMVFWSF